MCVRLPFIPWSIVGVPSSQALPDFLFTAPPPVFVPAVLGALAVWIQNQFKKNTHFLVPLDPAGQQMIGQYILFKWPTYGWCLGKIWAWNTNPKRKVCKQTVNFIVFYPDNGSSGPHCLSLDNYNIDADDDSPNHTWLLLEPSKT